MSWGRARGAEAEKKLNKEKESERGTKKSNKKQKLTTGSSTPTINVPKKICDTL